MLPSSPRRHGGRALLAALLASALTGARAQDGSGQDQQVNTAMVALLAAVVAVFVFIAASTVYLRHCSGYAASRPPPPGDATVVAGSLDSFFASRSWWHRQRRRGRGGRGSGGLDTEVVEAFPTMTYAEAKALRVGKTKGGEALECVVCLSEFEDGERLRLLLPKCSHVFHPDCIAEWLAGHVTCPVCRCNLETASDDKDTTSATGDGQGQPPPPTISFASSISSETAAALQGAAAPLPVAVVIDVATEEDEEERRQEALELQRIGSQRRAVSGRRPAVELARWHSTVRSQSHPLAARLERDLERFTLRLPEHVRTEIVAAAAAKHSSRLRRGRRRRAGQGGGAGARSEPLVGRLGSRWQSLLGGTTFSGRLSFFSASRVTGGSGGGGEVSSSSSYSYAKLRGKRVAAIDVRRRRRSC